MTVSAEPTDPAMRGYLLAMKSDERRLLIAYIKAGNYADNPNRPYPPDVSGPLGIPYKRRHSILEKWDGIGWLECGVSVESGWLQRPGDGFHPQRRPIPPLEWLEWASAQETPT